MLSLIEEWKLISTEIAWLGLGRDSCFTLTPLGLGEGGQSERRKGSLAERGEAERGEAERKAGLDERGKTKKYGRAKRIDLSSVFWRTSINILW